MRDLTGSQCNWWRIGVIWVNFLERVISLAAEFWMRCNLFSWQSERPYNKLLQLSMREDTNACTSISVVFISKWLRIFPILYRAWEAARQMLLTCRFRFKFWSNTTPRFLALVAGSTSEFPIWSDEMEVADLNREVMWIISVLSSFSFISLAVDQDLMSLMQASNFESTKLWPSFIDSKAQIWVSSAYIMLVWFFPKGAFITFHKADKIRSLQGNSYHDTRSWLTWAFCWLLSRQNL